MARRSTDEESTGTMAKAKKAKKAAKPGHYTEKGTRKFQSNGPIEWSAVFKAAAKAGGGEREGEGIRAAMAYAIDNSKAFLAWVAKGHKVELKSEAK